MTVRQSLVLCKVYSEKNRTDIYLGVPQRVENMGEKGTSGKGNRGKGNIGTWGKEKYGTKE